MFLGARENAAHRLDVGGYVEYTMLLAFMVAPIVQLVSIGTQLTEALAGLDRTTEIMGEAEEDSEARRTTTLPEIDGHGRVRPCDVRVRGGQAGAAWHQLRVAAGDGDGAGGVFGVGQVDDHQPDLRVPHGGGRGRSSSMA